MVLMSMLLSGPLLVGEHMVMESVAGESFITWCDEYVVECPLLVGEHVVMESVGCESFITWC